MKALAHSGDRKTFFVVVVAFIHTQRTRKYQNYITESEHNAWKTAAPDELKDTYFLILPNPLRLLIKDK